jgi:hypothetical protein
MGVNSEFMAVLSQYVPKIRNPEFTYLEHLGELRGR